MKQITSLQIILLLLVPFFALSQVGIGTITPNAQLDIQASNQATPTNTDGVLIPKVDEFPGTAPTAAQDGMLLFATGAGAPAKGFYYWNNAGSGWVALATGSDEIDWYEEGTNTKPDDITDNIYTMGNVAIGKNTADYSLDIENNSNTRGVNVSISGVNDNNTYGHYILNENSSAFSQYGSYISMNGGAGSGSSYGTYNNMNSANFGLTYGVFNKLNGVSAGGQIGMRSDITTSASGASASYGVQNTINSNGNSTNYGTHSSIIGIGSGFKYGAYNYLDIDGGGFQTGTSNRINGTGTAVQYGTFNLLSGDSSGTQYGIDNIIQNTGNGDHYGIRNVIQEVGAGSQYGTYNIINNTGSGTHYGTYNALEGVGEGEQYGSFNTISNSRNNSHLGVYSFLNGNGTGNKYGVYATVAAAAGGTHYGVFSEVLKPGSFAGYFSGFVIVSNGDFEVINTADATMKVAAASANNAALKIFEAGDFGYEFQYNGTTDKLHLWSRMFSGNEAIRMTWLKNGNVGISNTNPAYALDVTGDINTSGSIRQSGGAYSFPDYVFETYFEGTSAFNSAYTLQSLASVEAFLKKNHHLPGVQSRADVAKSGWNVSENVRTNLEKIEELYLYTIEADKKIKEQEQQIKKLTILVNKLLADKNAKD